MITRLCLIILATAVSSVVSIVDGPGTSAVCLPVYSWMNNSMQQSPCLFAAYLEGNCGTGDWNIPALPQGNVYNGPKANQSNPCFCSSVVYNAVSACAACQGEQWITWPAWKQPCQVSDVTDGAYNVAIPPSTAIPVWAYQDPMQQITLSFNVTAADAVAALNKPDVTHANQPGATTTPTPTASAKSKTPIGAIVGGVIGGIALIAGIALLTWYLMQRRYQSRASQAPSKQYINKWSKGVVGGPPSRWGGTSYGDSVMGEPQKEQDAMMASLGSPDGMPYAQSPYGTPGLTSYSTSGGYSKSPEAISPGTYFTPSTPSSRSHGHKRGPTSGSSTKSKRHLLSSSPPTANGITPFILPPLDAPTVVSGGRPSLETTTSPSERTGATTPFSSLAANTSHQGPVYTELPSTIEYLGNRRPPVPNAPPAPAPAPNASRTSLGTSASRPGYYNPDDPSTYPISAIADAYAFSPTSHHPSNNGQPPSSTFFPNSSTEKLPFGGLNRPYTPQTPATGGHLTASRQQTPAVPPLPSYPSPQSDRNPNPLNMNISMAGSVHTLPGTSSPITPAQGTRNLNRTPEPRPFPAEPSAGAGGIFNSWNKRGKGAPPPTTWTPHVAPDEPVPEFNPYSRQ